MRDKQQELKIELLSQWKLEAESRNNDSDGTNGAVGELHRMKIVAQ